MDELKRLPDDVLSFNKAIEEVVQLELVFPNNKTNLTFPT